MHHYYFILYATVPTMLLYIPPGCLSIPQIILPIQMSVSIIVFVVIVIIVVIVVIIVIVVVVDVVRHLVILLGGPVVKMSFFQMAPGSILSTQIS